MEIELGKAKYKVFVGNPKVSTRVQEHLFKLGCSWFGKNNIEEGNFECLYIDEYKLLTYSMELDNFFNNHDSIEVTVSDILKLELPKKIYRFEFKINQNPFGITGLGTKEGILKTINERLEELDATNT